MLDIRGSPHIPVSIWPEREALKRCLTNVLYIKSIISHSLPWPNPGFPGAPYKCSATLNNHPSTHQTKYLWSTVDSQVALSTQFVYPNISLQAKSSTLFLCTVRTIIVFPITNYHTFSFSSVSTSLFQTTSSCPQITSLSLTYCNLLTRRTTNFTLTKNHLPCKWFSNYVKAYTLPNLMLLWNYHCSLIKQEISTGKSSRMQNK